MFCYKCEQPPQLVTPVGCSVSLSQDDAFLLIPTLQAKSVKIVHRIKWGSHTILKSGKIWKMGLHFFRRPRVKISAEMFVSAY